MKITYQDAPEVVHQLSNLQDLIKAEPDGSIRSAICDGLKEGVKQRLASNNRAVPKIENIIFTRTEGWEFCKLPRIVFDDQFSGFGFTHEDLFHEGPSVIEGKKMFGGVAHIEST